MGGATDSALLREALNAIRADLRRNRGVTDHDDVIDAMLRHLGSTARRPGTSLAAASPDREGQAAIADVVGAIARRLAPDDEPPAGHDAAAAWRSLLVTADELYGSGVAPMGRLPFISARLLEIMAAEAAVAMADRPKTGARVSAAGGRALRSLAVSGKLQAAVGAALGVPVEPNYTAVYLYDPPGSHVQTHLDTREYEVVFHLVLEHELPSDRPVGSALIVHLPGRAPTRLAIGPGECVALSGRGTMHSWEALRRGEQRLLIGIGWMRDGLTGRAERRSPHRL